jgi:uncharacterized protein
METKRISTITLVLCLSAVLGVEWIASLTSLGSSFKIIGATRFVQILLMVWIVKTYGGGFVSIGLEYSGWFHGFRKGLLWSLAFGAAAFLIYFLLLIVGVNALGMIRAPMPGSVQGIALLILIGGIVAPVAEEIFFGECFMAF